MSIGSLAEFFLAKPEITKITKESGIPAFSSHHTPDELRVRRNKLAKIQGKKA